VAELHRSGVKITVVGSRADLEPGIVCLLDDAERLTRENSKLNLIVAFNYGSRQEIGRAMVAIARKVERGEISAADI
jgi:undecaprenyl diphosphate synthase